MIKVPHSIKVGRKRYKIRLQDDHPHALGTIAYNPRIINIALRRANRRRLPHKEVSESFWHETVHAVLYEMKHPLFKNERFVTQFAHLLNNVIYSAQFK
jgi:hypothetical protein